MALSLPFFNSRNFLFNSSIFLVLSAYSSDVVDKESLSSDSFLICWSYQSTVPFLAIFSPFLPVIFSSLASNSSILF